MPGTLFGAEERGGKPRTVEVVYLDEKVGVVVESLWEEICLRASVCLKHAGMGSTKTAGGTAYLTPMFCEGGLKPFGQLQVRDIDEDLLNTHQSARESANAQLAKTRHCVGEHVMQFLDDHIEVLSMVDAAILIEAAFFD